MIKVGQRKKAKYWGNFEVKKVAMLAKPVACHSDTTGDALFNPTLVKIQWGKSPSSDSNDFWFPYWITINGKEKYGQFAPMIGEQALLELLRDAINQRFFSQDFTNKLFETLRKVK